jgi:hypothetical protein
VQGAFNTRIRDGLFQLSQEPRLIHPMRAGEKADRLVRPETSSTTAQAVAVEHGTRLRVLGQ